MTELRADALTGRQVLLVPGRSARPHTTTVAGGDQGDAAPACPFCAGHETETPPEVARTGGGSPDGPGWRVRVVPNLYPIVGGPTAGPGATGAHEVVILSPNHVADFGSLADSQATEVLTVLRDRARVHADAGHTHVQVLVNHGRAAGASIAHPHAQVLAIDVVPPAVAAAALRVAASSADLVGDDHAAALEAGSHVLTTDGIAAWCPLASGSPFEVRIASLSAGARFEAASDPEIHSCALVLRDVLGALARVLGDPPYNVVVHGAAAGTTSSSSDAGPTDRGRWWIEVTPRVSVVAGFEVGTGLLVNTEDPVVAAGRLREGLGSAP